MAASVHPSTDTVRPAIDEHIPDIFTIICCNDSFQLALDLNTIKTLLRVCKRAQYLLSFKLARFHSWCQNAGLCDPDGQLRIGLAPSDQIALSMHCEDPVKTGRSWLEDQADQGNAAASFFLARILQVYLSGGRFVRTSEWEPIQKEIICQLEKAAEADHIMAQFHLAECYHNGLGVDRDHTKAVELYRSLADRGMAQAQIALGGCYEAGEGVDQDFDTAIEWYSKASNQGSDDGRLHIEFLRGWLSFIGHGIEQSDADALNRWQEVSSHSTNSVLKPIATHMVGWMHYLGRGTVQDMQKGVRIIRENESDEFKLGEGECLASLENDIKSDSLAPRKFFELCQLGLNRDWLCKHLMAACLYYGFGTTKNQTKAAGIFEQLAKDGHSDSQFWIGECYLHGEGVSKDKERAFEWFSKSADQGNSYGQWMVGECYYWGHEVTEDLTKAAELFCKSAEQGNRNGQERLGLCYLYGRGVPSNFDTAIIWYRKSADQDDWNAIIRLKSLGKWP